ncbi:hypothetical protein BZA05DRAFT_439097 [Tricharina praecox]|uniref:uncharacterized protein n=1 Tax=Tricharina praecox TaxID=43433 RepID=UPI002220EFEE|nr:uncharacterized protein BZA05DRAFT_439097 [Tricharina praecox]KAI5843686.1 hypothetical protein BZA05DRAFT_439097 [Tricharina praecox]
MTTLVALPAPILCSIFDATNSLTTAVSLARCDKLLHKTWTTHLSTLDLVAAFDADPRWCEIRYKFFAVTIARTELEAGGNTDIDPLSAMKSAYRIAGVIQRTVRELVSYLTASCPSPRQKAVWDRWLPHVLMKTLHMLWLQKLVGRAPLDPQYHLATKTMAEFLLAPKWHTWGFPDMRGVLGAGTIRNKAPANQLLETCVAVCERVVRNKKALGEDLEEDEEDSEAEEDEFYDDSEYDDISEFDEDELDEDDAGNWSDE